MPVTLKELAARANVHPSTISRVANNDPGLRIATGHAVAHRGAAARDRLPAQRDRSRAEAAPDATCSPSSSPTSPTRSSRRCSAASRTPRRHAASTCCSATPTASRSGSDRICRASRPAASTASSSPAASSRTRAFASSAASKRPYVLVNRFSDEGEDPFVGSDDLLGGQLATAHLIDLGHTRIGHLAGKSTVSTGMLRRRGYLAAHTAAGLAADPDLIVEAGYTEESGAAAARRLLSIPDPPTAIFAVTDMVALGTAEVARQMGLRIPEDLAIVGLQRHPAGEPGQPRAHHDARADPRVRARSPAGCCSIRSRTTSRPNAGCVSRPI